MTRLLLIFSFILCIHLTAFAQREMGIPFTQYYSPATYDAASQNWDIIQDKDGVIYIGNY